MAEKHQTAASVEPGLPKDMRSRIGNRAHAGEEKAQSWPDMGLQIPEGLIYGGEPGLTLRGLSGQASAQDMNCRLGVCIPVCQGQAQRMPVNLA